jgi:hypothetical protein
MAKAIADGSPIAFARDLSAEVVGLYYRLPLE